MTQSLFTCCFTGHRTIESHHREALSLLLDEQLRQLISAGVHTFAAGGALGFDTLAAEAVLSLQSEFSHIRLVVVAPCADQTAGWRRGDALRYERIREQADDFICLSAAYIPGCMQRRNRHLIDMSGICLAYCLHSPSGTAQTMAYAKQQQCKVVNLAEMLGEMPK